MGLFKTSLISTVFNEEENVGALIDSVHSQSLLPNEFIIVDGGSNDNTVGIIKEKIKQYPNLNIKLYIKKGNRSIGRNDAIKQSKNEIVAITDAGSTLDKEWFRNIVLPFENSKIDVVAGYYRGKYENAFQKSLIPYALVMEDKINPGNFLPATRSMALKRSVWRKVGGFNEKLSHNEDYAFANEIKTAGYKIYFQKNAIAYWIPRRNIIQAFKMFFRFAYGDIESGILRPNVVYIYLRYFLIIYLLGLVPIIKSIKLDLFLISLFLAYIIWSISKNFKYVRDIRALFYLPLLQITSDFSVISGSAAGFIRKIHISNLLNYLLSNKGLILIIFAYSSLMLALIDWGIPNANHPFNYAMDEWHFSQSLRAFLKQGTALISGSANIPLYHVVSSIIFIVPFYIFRAVDPFAIKTAVSNLSMQHTFFEILRLHTLFYGILSALLIYKVIKKHFNFFPALFTAFFVFNPIFLLLTNYYKYDISLLFFIITSLYFLMEYGKSQKFYQFILAGVSCGLALSTKFTAAPLVMVYFLSYFFMTKNIEFKKFLASALLVFFTFILIGIPDVVFGRGNYYELLYSTLILSPSSMQWNIANPIIFLLAKELPSIFGHFLTITFYISLIYLSLNMVFKMKQILKFKNELFLFLATILFLISTLSFNLEGGGNRSLVLLPFFILICVIFIKKTFESGLKYSKLVMIILLIGLMLQIIESSAWLSVKFFKDPREVSSYWILKNIPKQSTIGIENIPIYQMIPDIALREFYSKRYMRQIGTNYDYLVLDNKNWPEYIIFTNDSEHALYSEKTSKNVLLKKMREMGYKKIISFAPNLYYYNFFADKSYFLITNIIQMPVSISIYGNK